MGTTIRAKISEKNPYWIEKHRYYELKHFCLQYPIWKKIYGSLDGLSGHSTDFTTMVVKSTLGDPTAKIGMAKAYYSNRMKMLEQTASRTDETLGIYILNGVTDGWSYDILKQVSEKVDIEVQHKVKAACDNIVFDVKTSMYNKISDAAEKAVSSTYQSMEVEAKERIRKELRNIDISALKREVKSEAKDAVAEKLQASMDDILETYNSNLANVQNIYSSIAKSMSARA